MEPTGVRFRGSRGAISRGRGLPANDLGLPDVGGALEGVSTLDEEVEGDGDEGQSTSGEGFGDAEVGDELAEEEGAEGHDSAEGQVVDAHDAAAHGVSGQQ